MISPVRQDTVKCCVCNVLLLNQMVIAWPAPRKKAGREKPARREGVLGERRRDGWYKREKGKWRGGGMLKCLLR